MRPSELPQISIFLLATEPGKAACSIAATSENSPADLVRLMRIANNPLQQELIRHRMHVQGEKLQLQKHALELRAEQQKNRAESPKTTRNEAIEKSLKFRKYCENHPVLKGIVAEPKSYEETAKENDYLYRTGTNTSPYRVVGPIHSEGTGSGSLPNSGPASALASPLKSDKTEEQKSYCTPLGNPLRPDQKEGATWHPSMTEVEKDVAVLPSGIDHSIKAGDPATWPMHYKWIKSRGNIALLDYLCRKQIRTVTPRCFVPAELIHSRVQPSATDPTYIHSLERWGITFYARHPITNVWLTPDLSNPHLSVQRKL